MALTAHNGALLSENSLGGHINLPPGATGYREVTTTVTRETNGIPTTSREYQIEYLNPANSVTVLDDKGSNAAAELLVSNLRRTLLLTPLLGYYLLFKHKLQIIMTFLETYRTISDGEKKLRQMKISISLS